MNWTAYWISVAVIAVVLAVAMAVQMGSDPAWKESEQATDMLLNIGVCALAGALWPLAGFWLVLTWVNDRARARRRGTKS